MTMIMTEANPKLTPMNRPVNTTAMDISLVKEKMKTVTLAELRLDLFKVLERKKIGCQAQEAFLKMINLTR